MKTKILFFNKLESAIYWYRQICSILSCNMTIPSRNIVRYTFKIGDTEYRFCSIADEERIKIGQPKNTKYFYGMEHKFEKDFKKTLKEVLCDE